MNNYDLFIIGAGPGGYETALLAARSGLGVAIAEERASGGTCLHEGCIPTKCLAHSAELLDEVRGAAAFGISCEKPAFDISAAVRRKDEVVEKLTAGIDGLFKSAGVTVVRGKASLADSHTVVVGEERYSARNVIIATGSRPNLLPVPGHDLPCVLTSTEMLSLTEVPRRLCIIGGGVIGMEFAGIFNAFGSEVTVVEYCKEILPPFDKDMAKRLRTVLKKKGVNFQLDSAVQSITSESGEAVVAYQCKGKESSLTADKVLMAVGRGARVEDIGLDDLGIAYTRKGIVVDENMQTSVPGVYAIGDVNGLCPLAHAAVFQGKRAVHHIMGETDDIDFSLVPSAVYTSPGLASVGLREEDFGDVKPVVVKAFFRANGRALTMGADEGLMKLLFDAEERLRGVQILGECASELIHEATVLVAQGVTRKRLHEIIHAHPTLSELYLTE